MNTNTLSNLRRSSHIFKAKKSSSMVDVGFMGDVQKINEFQVELTKYNNDVEQALMHARQVSIDSDDDATSNVELAGNMRKLSKRIEMTKKDITSPAREFVAKMNALANGYTEKLEQAIGLISSKVGKYNLAKVEEQQKELEILAILEEAAGIQPSFVTAAPVKENTQTALASTYQRQDWSIEVEDISKVPMQFLMINESLVKTAIKSGRSEIPGLKITEQKITCLRTR